MGATLAFAGPPRAVADESIADRTVTATAVGCARPLLAATRTAAFVASHNPTALETAAQRSGLSVERLTSMAEDRDVRINRCGRAFYVDRELMASPAQAQAAQAATSTTALRPLSETFNLESKPGSSRTIYLDFRGGTINGTAWNVDYGANLVAEPYSKDGAADTSFSNAELTEIQKAWQAVAEDYAPFNVNVTTRDLGAAAIDRADANDQVFGTRVLVTNGGTIYNDCTCGGVAYLNVYTISGADHGYYQPAWVFSNGTTKAGKYMAEAITHEVGHNFGLSHDGTQTADYSSGTSPWGPIMGAPYNMPVTQWSKGEYPGANNQQDDLAIIAGGAPLRADDHGNTAAAATAFTASTGASGVISTRADVDAFKFTGSGSTTVTLKGADGMPDLDAQLTILDQNGATVATVNPAVQYVSAYEASGLGATWTGNLPAGGATYTVLVDGVGSGAPSVAGRYSDYGSLGNYTVDVTTGAGSGTNTVTVTNPGTQSGTVGTAKSLQIQASDSAAGQTLTYSATGLPTGLTFNAGTGLISGTPTTAGSTSVTVTVRDTTNASGSTTFTWNIAAAPTTTCSGNRVSNGGFESGATGWTATSGVIGSFTDQPARTGTKAAWLDGYGSSHTDKVSRNVSIPAGCKAKLSFWLHIDTAENNAADPTAYDQLTIRAGTTVLGTFSNLNAANGYVLRQYDVSAFAGQTVTISFTGVEDSSLQTSFVLDDVSVTLS